MSTPSPAVRLFRFEAFALNLHAGELYKRGVKLHLQGQLLQLLGILVQSPGNLVTREELRNQLWPADTFVDFDHGLHNAIARLREALGDSPTSPRFIETLPRKGYRFIGDAPGPAPLEADDGERGRSGDTGEAAAVTRRRGKLRAALGAAAALGG